MATYTLNTTTQQETMLDYIIEKLNFETEDSLTKGQFLLNLVRDGVLMKWESLDKREARDLVNLYQNATISQKLEIRTILGL